LIPTEWLLAPWTVFGGWRIARTRWVRDRNEDLDLEEDFEGLPDTIFPTKEECEAAIIAELVS
jgi:hypothetical protein